MAITLSDPEAALFHAMLVNAAANARIMGQEADRLRNIAARLVPTKDGDLPPHNHGSHMS